VKAGDHVSISTKSGRMVSGVVLNVSDEGITLEHQEMRAWNDSTLITVISTIPWKNQKRRFKLHDAR